MTVAERTVELLGAAIGEGAPDPRCRAGPAALKRWGLGRRLAARGRKVRWGPTVESDPTLAGRGALAIVEEFSARLAAAVAGSCRARRLPIVIGGDHSCAVGTWSGVHAAMRERVPAATRLGLVWIDAHLDSHTPETSESQMPHGMSLAALLGHGPQALTSLLGPAPKVAAERTVLIGPRSWEPGEAALLERLGVRVMAADEVERRGFADCMAEAVEQVSTRSDAWGISFDLDALDPADAPGTGTPVDAGIRVGDVVRALHGLGLDERFVACELVEYNPALDADRLTAYAADCVLGSLIERRAGRVSPCEHTRRAGDRR